MKLTADCDGNIRHFFAKLSWKEHFDPREIEILTACAVPMLIPPISVQGRRNHIIQYDISSYSTLEFYLTCILSREQFAELLLQSINTFQRMQQIYLNYKNLVFDFDKIYVQLSDRTIHFIYLPLMNSAREASQPEFFRLLISKAVRSTYEQSSFLDSCLAWINRPAPFVLSEFEHFIKEQTCVGAVAVVRPADISKSYVPSDLQPDRFVHPELKKVETPKDISAEGAQGHTSRLDEPREHDTVLLGENGPSKTVVRYYIQRVQSEEKIELTHFPFLVGTELGSVAYCVSGNAAVSRRHAEFSIQEGECMIIDQRSTNKTYINDYALPPFIPQPLKDGDIIRLGNEKFKFIREEQA